MALVKPRNAVVELDDIIRIQRKLQRIQDSIFSISLMKEIGLYMQTKVKARTLEGEDVDNKSFKPYSPEYAEYREKHGRPTRHVDLFFHGNMLASMTFKSTDNKARLYFTGTDQNNVRNAAKAFYLNEERTFFGLSDDEVDGILDIVDDYYGRILNGF